MQPAGTIQIFLFDTLEYGGGERSSLALSRWLYQHGLQHRLVTYVDRIGFQKYADHPLDLLELKPEDSARSKIAAMKRYVETLPAGGGARVLISGFQPALHASVAGLRGFHTLMHDTESLFSDGGKPQGIKDRLRHFVSRQAVRRGLGSGGRTIVASEFLRRDSQRLYGGDVVICRLGGMAEGVTYRPRVPAGSLRMLSVARVEENKRIDWMLRALHALEGGANPLSARVDWHLDVVGKGSLIPELSAMSQELGLAQRVHFHGFVDDARLAAVYDAADLFLMPARQGYGIPALEALYRGMPVLLHRESGVSDILLDTPWATVMEGGEANLAPALEHAVDSLLAGRHLQVPRLDLPTEESWAEGVAKLCGWV